ncbi:carbohydrate ABC transporter permease [Jiangella anatolica]|uniref:carbohydrate ABC transporter permease n=1 Tax=Jiangella anatolica TaxID=2670374 RepID=UPI001F33C5B3|nr:sugar ABC transporter permease [Jiangella anatolica]
MPVPTRTVMPVATPASPASRRRVSWREARVGLLFVLPCLLFFVAFRFGPAIAGALLGFTDYQPGAETSWTGLENFRRMADDPLFWRALRTTLLYSVLAVPLSILAALAMALLVRRAFRGVRLFRSICFLPVVTSPVLAGIVFTWIFAPHGPWSSLMGAAGLRVSRGCPIRHWSFPRSSSSPCGRGSATACSSCWPACRTSRASWRRPR